MAYKLSWPSTQIIEYELLSEAKGLSSEQLDHLIAIAKGLKK